jgi:hypothetical protein
LPKGKKRSYPQEFPINFDHLRANRSALGLRLQPAGYRLAYRLKPAPVVLSPLSPLSARSPLSICFPVSAKAALRARLVVLERQG